MLLFTGDSVYVYLCVCIAIAVLDALGVSADMITACFIGNPRNEEAVQTGLTKWLDGQGKQRPTWGFFLQPWIKKGLWSRTLMG